MTKATAKKIVGLCLTWYHKNYDTTITVSDIKLLTKKQMLEIVPENAVWYDSPDFDGLCGYCISPRNEPNGMAHIGILYKTMNSMRQLVMTLLHELKHWELNTPDTEFFSTLEEIGGNIWMHPEELECDKFASENLSRCYQFVTKNI